MKYHQPVYAHKIFSWLEEKGKPEEKAITKCVYIFSFFFFPPSWRYEFSNGKYIFFSFVSFAFSGRKRRACVYQHETSSLPTYVQFLLQTPWPIFTEDRVRPAASVCLHFFFFPESCRRNFLREMLLSFKFPHVIVSILRY